MPKLSQSRKDWKMALGCHQRRAKWMPIGVSSSHSSCWRKADELASWLKIRMQLLFG
ncbi:14 kDa zinc-binding protein [Iris pallida]|uniref:14 kDa zinc-binding protein n=1 Tax=Iris pallida TaxID=29817 RepID=A0AAX6EBP3_IRIPA|nr:14 kDa zinc-binding protein [Iris pallida]